MKKEEKLKYLNSTKEAKTYQHHRSRSHSPKAYLGCDTCKLKNVELLTTNKSVCKISDYNCSVSKIKFKSKPKKMADAEKEDLKKGKVKLTDLCYDDKRRIVELIEELSKFAEKNQKLNEMLDGMQKSRQEQQDYIMKQTNLHLEEKNFYINEINVHKSKLESAEKDLKNKALLWEKQERAMNNEIAYLTKALRESANEKKELSDQMNHLRNCLKQSLESFHQLKNEIVVLQHHHRPVKRFKSVFSQTEEKSSLAKDKFPGENVDGDEELVSTWSQNSADGKSSLEVINDKLEDVYKLLKKKGKTCEKSILGRKLDIDLSIFSRSDKFTEILINNFQDESSNPIDETDETNSTETGYKLIGPFDENGKMSNQAGRILDKMGRPLISDCGHIGDHEKTNKIQKFYRKKKKKIDETWPNSIVQKNTLYRSEDERQNCEDKLLEDLFYKIGNLKLDVVDLLHDEEEQQQNILNVFLNESS